MAGKRIAWATYLVVCWTLLPTSLSYFWGFQDYFQDWASARNWWEGISVYSPHSESTERYQSLLSTPDHRLGPKVTLHANAHPPTSVLFYLPFALCSYGLSFLAWNLVSAAAMALAVHIVAEELEFTLTSRHLLFLGPLGIVCGPLFEQMFLGQSNAVSVALIVLAWQAHRRGWQVREGCWLGVAIALRLYPVVLLMIPLGGRRWRSLGSALATALLFFFLSVTLLHPDIWREYARVGLPEAVAWGDAWPNASLSGFWKKLFVSQNKELGIAAWHSPLAFWIGYAASSIAIGATTLWLAVRGAGTKSGNVYALGTCAMLLLSPTCWPHYFLMLLLPLVLLREDIWGGARRRAAFLTCAALLFLPANFYCMDPGWIARVAGPGATLSVLAIQTYALVGLWSLAAMQTYREWKGMMAVAAGADVEARLAA
jgi:hypothetical protein